MAEDKRKSIETRIRQLSFQLRKELLEQQKQGQPQRINTQELERMLDAWGALAKYYEDSIYSENVSDPEMSLFIVGNYLEWVRNLQIFRIAAERDKAHRNVDELEEMLLILEVHMKDILAAVSSIDNMSL